MQTHGGDSASLFSADFRNLFHCQILQYVCSKVFITVPPHLVCVATLLCETLMSENERQSQTNAVSND